jgi:ferric-dicitrate binding protein FerR (iron transport regulator)
MAAAAGVVMAAVIGIVIVTPGEGPPRYRVVDGTVKGKEVLQTGASGAMLRLSDRSWVEMRSNTELSVVGVPDGMGIRLRAGGIIVNAAKQEPGHHLYVYTKDMTVSVVGTIFIVDADARDGSSRVGVIEGEVRVQDGAVETTLRPGERVSTGPKPDARSLRQDVAWSRQSEAYNRILDAFMRGMNNTAARLQEKPAAVAEPSEEPAVAGTH